MWCHPFGTSYSKTVVGLASLLLVVQSEWVRWETGYDDDFNDIQFLNREVGWITGTNDTILHTTDGGYEWTRQTGEWSNLPSWTAISMVNEQVGWISGTYSKTLYTVNGGAKWNHLVTGVSHHIFLQDVKAFSESEVCFIGDSGTIIRSISGGRTSHLEPLLPNIDWQFQNAGTWNTLYSMSWLDRSTGWVVGGQSTVLHTTDAGQNWQKLYSTEESGILGAVHFENSRLGYAGGVRGRMMRTEMGGTRWYETTTCTRTPPLADVPDTWAVATYKSQWGQEVWSTTSTGQICYTYDDALIHWIEQRPPDGVMLTSSSTVTWDNNSTGGLRIYVVGYRGTLLYYTGSPPPPVAGVLWSHLYVDAEEKRVTFNSLPTDGWGHIHLEASFPFTDNMNLFSRNVDGDAHYIAGQDIGACKGALTEVYFWDRVVDQQELLTIIDGFNAYWSKPDRTFNQGLLSLYALEEGEGTLVRDNRKEHPDAALVNGATWSHDIAPKAGWRETYKLIVAPSPPPPPPLQAHPPPRVPLLHRVHPSTIAPSSTPT
ncbi:hypothetical protein CYMTET_15668 [Cymbomonas tetramitiformis]|uniref:Photosynthesis system II assembly factor Ycf48/Hcf136-like domain-containing protein n=1 Tax=Cymbomonas tetramitiformis TaxID=36881 RepID=A0AAE0L923_9CHLO|nr:hypothetical protein CYMTET_15668 [Cymbomonas tetramitiformis]